MGALKLAVLVVAAQSLATIGFFTIAFMFMWGYQGLALPLAGWVCVSIAAAWVVLRNRL